MDTTGSRAGNFAARKKAAFSRGLLELSKHQRCPGSYCLGVVGAAGFAVPVGFGAAGFAAPVAGGAATPDCALYPSTTALVISIVSPHHSTLLCGHGFEVSTIMPKPLSWEYFTIMGAIFCRIRVAIS